jgi:transcriptional regulator with XRE-family HTH domain
VGERFPRLQAEVVQAIRTRAAALRLYTDAALCRKAGLSPSDVSPVFNRKRAPSLRVVRGIARALDASVEEVLAGQWRDEAGSPDAGTPGRWAPPAPRLPSSGAKGLPLSASIGSAPAPELRSDAGASPIPLQLTDNILRVRVYAEASAGRGSGGRLNEFVHVPSIDAAGRKLVAVRVRGHCMYPKFMPGDTVFFEKVPDDEIASGDLVLITLLDQEEDGAYNVKYLHWAPHGADTVILTAEDETRLEVPYDRVVIEGRYWRMVRE